MLKKIFLPFFLFHCIFSFSQVDTKDLAIDTGTKIAAIASTQTDTWIGTNDGIFKINKKTKKVAHLKKENSMLPSNNVTSLCARKNGDIWIGTSNGILRYDNYSYLVINTENAKIPENTITALAEDNSGDIWIGTLKSGLAVYHIDRYKIYDRKNSILPTNTIFSISADDRGNVWVAPYQKGLIQIHEKKWEAFQPFDTASTINISFVLKKNDSAVYIGSYKHGLYLYQKGVLSHQDCSTDLMGKMRYLTTINTIHKMVIACSKGLYYLNDLADVKDITNLIFYDDFTFLQMSLLMDF